jgi:hypothetical protein
MVDLHPDRQVIARLESSPKPSADGLRWKTLSETVLTFQPPSPTSGQDNWTASVPRALSSAAASSQNDYRLSLDESELFETDDEEAELRPPGSNNTTVPVRRRLVYADHIPLKLTGPNLLSLDL